MSGESLGHGLIVDLSVQFTSILETGEDWVRVQPGVVLDRLNLHLAERGRRFAPDPASSHSCTIGGMIATNASGGRAAIHGYTHNHVDRLRVIWDDGTADDVSAKEDGSTRLLELRAGIKELLQNNAEPIAACRPKTPFNRCGYPLHEVSDSNLVRLLVGSEGTLAFTTEARLRTIPLAGGRAAVAFGFPTFEAALNAGLHARTTKPAACEVLDRRLISLARAQSSDAAAAVPVEVEAALLVEYERDTPSLASEAVQQLIADLQQQNRSALLVIPAFDETTVADLWSLRASALPTLYAMGKGPRPLAFVEDIGVSPEDLPEFVTRSSVILKRFDASASFLIHVATGQMHLRPFLDPDDPADAVKLWPFADELHNLAIEMGGTVSSQHGTGLARTPWVEKQFGRLFPVFREVKRLFDPRGILNPGKIVGPDPSRPAWPLRKPIAQAATGSKEQPTEITRTRLLVWEGDELEHAVGACNGCGTCRTEDSTRRMCPTFRVLHTEAASPRAKANLFRTILEGGFDSANDDNRAVADLCVNCKMCASECPGLVDIPKLMLEAKAAHHAAHGLRRSIWFLARMEGLAGFGSKFGLTANFLLRRSPVRWALEKVFGLARQRILPAFAFRTFLGRARRRGLTRRPEGNGPAVAYFIDTFANVFDPAVAEASVAVLRHNGVPVYVPHRQRGTGAAALAHGDADVARERLTYNVRRLADCARAGDTIVCSEPTAALFFKLDALGLSDDPDVRLIAERTTELTDYLWTLHEQGKLRTDFQPLDFSVGHHVPCHIKALDRGIRGPQLLALIPGLRVSKIDVSCSGMAGTYGLNVKNLPISLAAGKPMLDEFARPRHLYGSSECSACRLQMQQGTGKRALHPVQYLALAYGLLPSVAERLRRPIGRRVST